MRGGGGLNVTRPRASARPRARQASTWAPASRLAWHQVLAHELRQVTVPGIPRERSERGHRSLAGPRQGDVLACSGFHPTARQLHCVACPAPPLAASARRPGIVPA